MAPPPQAVEALQECGLSHGVVYNPQPAAAGGFLYLFLKVLPGVQDDLISARILGQLGLGVSGHGGVDLRAQRLQHLDKNQPHAARPGVNQRRVPFLDVGDAVHQEVGRHPLQHGRRPGGEFHFRGQFDQQPGRDRCLLGVSAGVHGVRHPVSHSHFRHSFPNRGNHPSRLSSGRPREAGRWVEAVPAGHVGIVDPDGPDVYQGLSRSDFRDWRVLVAQHFRTAGLMGSHCFHALPPLRPPPACRLMEAAGN